MAIKPLRVLGCGFVLVIVLLVAGLVVAWFSINSLVKKGVEAGGTYALGVNTTLASADVGILSGSLSLSGLKVDNPKGFASPAFLSLGNVSASISLATLREPVIVVPTFSMDNLDVYLERKPDGANYRVIMDNLGKIGGGSGGGSGGSGGGSTPGKPAPTGDEKKLVVNDLRLRKITIHADLLGGPGAVGQVIGNAAKVTIPLDEIHLTNVGKTGTGVGGTGVTVSQLSAIIVQAVLNAAAEKGGGILPADLLTDLNSGLANLKPLKDLGITSVTTAGKDLEKAAADAAKKATETLDKAGKDLEKKGKDVLDKAGKGLTDLIPGGKK